eukprot:6744404-Prymnesium_polylepis.1
MHRKRHGKAGGCRKVSKSLTRRRCAQRRRPADPIAAWSQLGPMRSGQPRPTNKFGSSCDHAIIS